LQPENKAALLSFSHRLLSTDAGSVSEGHGERFHQDIRELEKRYQGGWTVNMIAGYCWILNRESHCVESCGRKTERRKFHPYQDVNCKGEGTLD
jgi:hypothetical protein